MTNPYVVKKIFSCLLKANAFCLFMDRVDDILSMIFAIQFLWKGDYILKRKFWQLSIQILDDILNNWTKLSRETILKVIKLPVYRNLLSGRALEYLSQTKGRDECLYLAQKLTEN